MKSIDLSIVTVCLNSAGTISKTLHSINAACALVDDLMFELLIIDGLSKDSTLAIVSQAEEESPDNLTYRVTSEKDSGIYDAMNKGITNSKGRYITFINSDDYLLPNSFALVQTFLGREEKLFLHSDLLWKFARGGSETIRLRRGSESLDDLLSGMSINHPTCILSRELFDEIGLFDSRLRYVADWEWTLRCRRAQVAFTYLPEARVVFSMEGVSGKYLPKRYLEIEKIYAELLKLDEISLPRYLRVVTRLKLSELNSKLSDKYTVFGKLKVFLNSYQNKTPPKKELGN